MPPAGAPPSGRQVRRWYLRHVRAVLALGREGPSVQMGASIAHIVSRIGRRDGRRAHPDRILRRLPVWRRPSTRPSQAPSSCSRNWCAGSRRASPSRRLWHRERPSARCTASLALRLTCPPRQPSATAFRAMLCFLLRPCRRTGGRRLQSVLIATLYNVGRMSTHPVLRGLVFGATVGLLAWSFPGVTGPGLGLAQRALDGVEPAASLPLLLLFRLVFSVLSYAVGTPAASSRHFW